MVTGETTVDCLRVGAIGLSLLTDREFPCISRQFGSWFSCIERFREILRFAQNDNLTQCVILRGGLCPEESLRMVEEEEIFLADVITACEKCGLDIASRDSQ